VGREQMAAWFVCVMSWRLTGRHLLLFVWVHVHGLGFIHACIHTNGIQSGEVGDLLVGISSLSADTVTGFSCLDSGRRMIVYSGMGCRPGISRLTSWDSVKTFIFLTSTS
jgi:hypothetical protein